MTTDWTSGAEVPEPEIAASSPAMIEAGTKARRHAREGAFFIWEELALVYRAMRRVEIAEQGAEDAEARSIIREAAQLIRSSPQIAEARATQDRIPTLFDAIAHGDQEHRSWLKKAIDDHFAGRPVLRPGGTVAAPPPGYRNAGEDEPERTTGWKP